MARTECKCCGFTPHGTGGADALAAVDEAGFCLPCGKAEALKLWAADPAGQARWNLDERRLAVVWLPECSQKTAAVLGRTILAIGKVATESDKTGPALSLTVRGARRMSQFLRGRDARTGIEHCGYTYSLAEGNMRDGELKTATDFAKGCRVVQIAAEVDEIDSWLESGSFADLNAENIEKTGAYRD